MSGLKADREAGRAMIMARLDEHRRIAVAAGYEANFVMSGKTVCVRETLVKFRMYEELKNNPFVVFLEEKSKKKKSAKDKETHDINTELAAQGKDEIRLGRDGRRLGISESAVATGVDSTNLRNIAKYNEGSERALQLVNAVLAANGKDPLTIGRDGQAVGLLDAGKLYELVADDPYLYKLSLRADGSLDAVNLVNAALAARGKDPLRIGRDGRTLGLLVAARLYHLVNKNPYLIQLSLKADGCVDAYNLVKAALAAAGESPLEIGRAGQVLGLLEAAKRHGLVGKDSYLSQLNHAADDAVTAHNLVNRVLLDAGENQLHPDNNGSLQGLLEVVKRYNLWRSNSYLNGLYKKSIFLALAANKRFEEAAAFFANEGLDPALDLEAKIRIVKDIFHKYLSTLRDRNLVQPFFQIFVACKGRADTIEGVEVIQQFNYEHFKAKWTTGVTPFRAVKEFQFFELYRTNNPPNSFLIEKALHQEADDCGSLYPTERLFSRIGTGGFNPAYHFPGKTYGVYLLVRYEGSPSSWVQVKSGVGKKRSREDSE